MSDDNTQWWFCLKHNTVEHGDACANSERMGPYAIPGGGRGSHRPRGRADGAVGQRPPVEGRLTRPG